MRGIDDETIGQFIKPMGHSKESNKNIYAIPPALNALKTVAPVIDQLHKVRYVLIIYTTLLPGTSVREISDER